jgi:hypothetical protein
MSFACPPELQRRQACPPKPLDLRSLGVRGWRRQLAQAVGAGGPARRSLSAGGSFEHFLNSAIRIPNSALESANFIPMDQTS